MNIAPEDNPFPTASIVQRHKAELEAQSKVWDGAWHSFDVSARAGAISISCDGIRLFTYDDSSPSLVGHIGLQSREGPVAFRNIRLRPTGLKPLLNGKDLEGWTKDRAEKCEFDITGDGELHVTNGPGQIDTTADFANFVLQAECKVNGDGLNSGFFFRTLREGIVLWTVW